MEKHDLTVLNPKDGLWYRFDNPFHVQLREVYYFDENKKPVYTDQPDTDFSKITTMRRVIYMWKKFENQRNPHYSPFEPKDSVKFETIYGTYTGKIESVDTDYYGGDCLVLYVRVPKSATKKYIAKRFAEKLG